jgi:hypothetical protein
MYEASTKVYRRLAECAMSFLLGKECRCRMQILSRCPKRLDCRKGASRD